MDDLVFDPWLFDFPVVRSPKRVRACADCGVTFESVDSADRVCPDCLKKESDARARPFSKSQKVKNLEAILELIEEDFCHERLEKLRKAREFDRLARLWRRIQHGKETSTTLPPKPKTVYGDDRDVPACS